MFNDNFSNEVKHGQYYLFAAAERTNICPTGWHVPNENEWEQLFNLYGGDSLAINCLISDKYWNGQNELITNKSGLSLLLGVFF